MIKSSCVCKKNASFSSFIVYKNEGVFKDYEGSVIGKCNTCGILKTFPSNKNRKFNPVITKAADYEKRRKEFENLFTPIVSYVEKYVKPNSSVLDVGCSSGILLSLLKRKGFNIFGIEPNKQAFLQAKNKLKKNIFNMTLSQFLRSSLSLRTPSNGVKQSRRDSHVVPLSGTPRNDRLTFDCIIYNHVLEHIEDINKEFKIINKVLKKNGVLVIGLPNTDNVIFNIRKKYWEYLLPNEHVWHFNINYLMKYLSTKKFKILGISFKDDDRKLYPTIKKIYFTLLTLFNKIMHTGEAVLLIAQKK